MTEAEWLASDSPELLIGWWCPADPLPDEDAPRVHQLRLIACGCCRRIWPLVYHERFRWAVEVAERFVRGRATPEDLFCAANEAELAAEEIEESSEVRSGLWPRLRVAVAKAAVGAAANDDTLFDLWDVPKAARSAAVLGAPAQTIDRAGGGPCVPGTRTGGPSHHRPGCGRQSVPPGRGRATLADRDRVGYRPQHRRRPRL